MSSFTLEIHGTKGEQTLIVGGPWDSAMSAAMEQGDVTGLDLNYARGFVDTDLRFLMSLASSGVKRIKVLSRTARSLEPIYCLSAGLEELGLEVSDQSAMLDLGKFPRLRVLSADWRLVEGSIGEANQLKHLYLDGYREPNLERLRWLVELRSLKMKGRPRLQSLEGVQMLSALEDLTVAGCRSLVNIDALGESRSSLSLLWLESTGFNDISSLAHHSDLVRLAIADAGPIDSLKPLVGLHRLERLLAYESTTISDHDLSVLLELPSLRELRMKSRRDYLPSVAEIEQRLLDRHDR